MNNDPLAMACVFFALVILVLLMLDEWFPVAADDDEPIY